MAFKLESWHIIAIILGVFLIWSGFIAIPGIDFGGQDGGTPWVPGGDSGGTPDTGDGLQIVSKTIKFVFIDKYAGSAPSGTGGYLYDSTGTQLQEGATNAISSGTWTTGNTYQSGTEMVVKYIYDTTIDDIYWYKFTVPKMTQADAESLTTNTIRIEVFDLPASLTDSCYDNLGNSFADAGSWNKTTGAATGPGANTATCTYSWYVPTDNDGWMESYDYSYKFQQQMVLWVKVFGANYENVILTGFEGAYEKGASMYYYHVIDPEDCTKYKVGQDYVYPGAGSFSWTVDLTGYSGDAADMQVYIEVYSNPTYHQQYGSFGPNAGEMAEQTVNLVD